MNLVKQTAIVTGSTRGIGKETALLLLNNGINVILSSKSQDSVDMPSRHLYQISF